MSWMRGKKCSSKRRGGIAWELYRAQDSGLFGGFKPSTAAPKAAPKRFTLSSNPICRVDSLPCYEWPGHLAPS